MATSSEQCEISNTVLAESKQHKATEKYHSAAHWFWSGLLRYPFIFIVSTIFSLFTSLIGLFPSILIGYGID
ncbi:MAG: hypothetical protein ACFFDW_16390, partial [Candidatus Thorarchaeota archaeon]